MKPKQFKAPYRALNRFWTSIYQRFRVKPSRIIMIRMKRISNLFLGRVEFVALVTFESRRLEAP